MKYQIVCERNVKTVQEVTKPFDVYAVVKRYAKAKQEQMICVTLNGAHEVISVSIVSIGTCNKTVAHPRDIMRKAICDNAESFVICHNHPSGSFVASNEDKEITKRMARAGQLIGIPLLDHLIITPKGFKSLQQEDRKLFGVEGGYDD